MSEREHDEFNHKVHQTQWIAVKHLSIIWASSQREFDKHHAKNIADNFDPEMFGVLSVTKPNGEGIYHLIDGQHRKDAVQQMYGENEKVPCVVFNATDPQRAAELFDKINTARKSPRPIDRFRVRVTARYKDELGVAKIVNTSGYKISSASDDNCIRCVDALVSVYKQYNGGVLAETLSILRHTFGPDPHAVDAPLVRGYGAFIASFAHALDGKRLVKVIQKTFTPGQLISVAKTAREMNRSSLPAGVVHVLQQHYNSGLKRNKLTAGTEPAPAPPPGDVAHE